MAAGMRYQISASGMAIVHGFLDVQYFFQFLEVNKIVLVSNNIPYSLSYVKMNFQCKYSSGLGLTFKSFCQCIYCNLPKTFLCCQIYFWRTTGWSDSFIRVMGKGWKVCLFLISVTLIMLLWHDFVPETFQCLSTSLADACDKFVFLPLMTNYVFPIFH